MRPIGGDSSHDAIHDRIYNAFLTRQFEEGMALARESDILELIPVPPFPPRLYISVFRCRGLVQGAGGQVIEADRFDVRVFFPEDYLRRVDPWQVLTVLSPANIWHPNIGLHAPVICAGHIPPGLGLVDLILSAFEIITYRKVTMREDNALNPAACIWARENQHRFPIDPRPLKRRRAELRIEVTRKEIAP